MTEILRLVLTSFWPFAAACILILVTSFGVAAVISEIASAIATIIRESRRRLDP